MEHPIPVAPQPAALRSVETKPGWPHQGEGKGDAGHGTQAGLLNKPSVKNLGSTASSNCSHQSTGNSTLKAQAETPPGVIRLPSEVETGTHIKSAKSLAGIPKDDARNDSSGAKVPVDAQQSMYSGCAAADGKYGGDQGFFQRLGNLRDRSLGSWLPEGKCVYIQSGDPSDFDGYLIARAGEVLSRMTSDMTFAVVVPEERAENRNAEELDERAEVSMNICGRMLRHLCPSAQVVRGDRKSVV